MELELCWGTLAGTPLEELVALGAGAGFGAVTATPPMVRAATARRAAGLADGLGVRISQLDPLIAPLPGLPPPGSLDDTVRPLFETGLEECLDLAAEVGAESVNLAHFRGDPATDPGALADAAAAVCAGAASRGLRVTIEYFAESAVPDLGAAASLVSRVGADNFTVLVDTLHHLRSGGTADAVSALPDGAVGALQIADRAGRDGPYVPMSGRALPGQGTLAPTLGPLVRAALSRARPGMPAGIEVFDAGLRRLGPPTAARLAAESLRALLAEAVQ